MAPSGPRGCAPPTPPPVMTGWTAGRRPGSHGGAPVQGRPLRSVNTLLTVHPAFREVKSRRHDLIAIEKLAGISCPSEEDKRAAGQRQLPKENGRGRRHWLPLAPGMSCAFDRPGRWTISSTAARWAPLLGIRESHPLDGRRHGIIFGHRSGLPSRRSAGKPAAGSYHPGVAASLSCIAPGRLSPRAKFHFRQIEGGCCA